VTTLLAVVLVIDVYVIVYYRLLVKYFYEKEKGVKESTLGALFSFPPYGQLPDRGKRYALRYWIAVAVLISCVALLARLLSFRTHA
jgi:hypothetical protein